MHDGILGTAQHELDEEKCPLPLFHQITSMSLIT